MVTKNITKYGHRISIHSQTYIERLVRFHLPAGAGEYYVMPRVRFHSSLDRDQLLALTKNVMQEVKPEVTLNWKNTQTIIFVEVLKRNCYMAILKDWSSRQKYNWQEYHKRQSKKVKDCDSEEKSKANLEQSESDEKSEKTTEKSDATDKPEAAGRKFEEPETAKSDQN